VLVVVKSDRRPFTGGAGKKYEKKRRNLDAAANAPRHCREAGVTPEIWWHPEMLKNLRRRARKNRTGEAQEVSGKCRN